MPDRRAAAAVAAGQGTRTAGPVEVVLHRHYRQHLRWLLRAVVGQINVISRLLARSLVLPAKAWE